MRLTTVLLSSTLFAFTTTSVQAQFTLVGGGCVSGGGTPTQPRDVNGPPRVGNVAYQVTLTPAAGTVACFWLIGVCSSSNFDYPLCGGSPCRSALDFTFTPALGGADVPPATVVTPFPIPNVAGLAGVTVCMQYLCFSSSSCAEISRGASIRIMP